GHIQTGRVDVKDHLHTDTCTVQLQGLVGHLVGVAELGAFDFEGHGGQGCGQGGAQDQGAGKGFHGFSGENAGASAQQDTCDDDFYLMSAPVSIVISPWFHRKFVRICVAAWRYCATLTPDWRVTWRRMSLPKRSGFLLLRDGCMSFLVIDIGNTRLKWG